MRAFGWLKQLGAGDTILITDTDGNTRSYSVTWSTLYEADSAPLQDSQQ